MSEKLFENVSDINVENLITKINEIVGEKFLILDEKDDIEKWNSVPKLLLLEKEDMDRLVSFVEFMDSLLVTKEEKAMYLVSLCGLIEFGHVSLKEYEEGSLFTLADYYQNSSIEEIENTLPIVGNQNLLLAIRYKTLDLEVRKELLADVVEEVRKANLKNKTQLLPFLEKKVQEIQEKDYYELVENK